MINTVVVTNDLEIIKDAPLSRTQENDVKFYWVDIEPVDEVEAAVLQTHFNFHPLAVEDCLHYMQRPKVDYYDGYEFLVLQGLNPETLIPEEIDLFMGSNFIVSFHLHSSSAISQVRQRKFDLNPALSRSPRYLVYLIMDKIVDDYFPLAEEAEDRLNQLVSSKMGHNYIKILFELRDRLLSLRRTIIPMRELLYRMLNSTRLEILPEERVYFADIDDHLIRLTEMIESSREITADLRDSYISINTNRTNTVMKTLTIVSTIFIPLTFVVGIYGMNFDNMPELHWQWGYFVIWGIMISIVIGMLLQFKFNGWFE